MSKTDTIDETLIDLLKRLQPDNVFYPEDVSEMTELDEAKAALSAMVAEIIGEDQHYHPEDSIYTMSGEPFEWAEKNELREEQRQRAAKLGFKL